MANLRAGLIGLGMMGRHHARVLGSLEGVDLVAVADPNGDKHGVADGLPVYENIEQLIAAGIDYCMVAVPTQYHAEIAKALADIYQITTRRQGPFPARIADVGVVLDLATHDIDLTAWVTQSPFVAVSAQSAHKSGRQYEDLIAVTGRLADGTVTSHLVNWLSPMKERITVVTGEKGAFIADTLLADLSFHA